MTTTKMLKNLLLLIGLSKSITAQICTAGFYNNGTGICSSCPTGTFSLAGATECEDCPTGFTQFDLSEENTNSQSCLTGCQAGYAGENCEMCPKGFFSPNQGCRNRMP